jgi:hypothetical protein
MNISELIESFCEEFGYEFYGDYSGRGMYGKRCVGIVCDSPMDVVIELCDYLRDNGVESATSALGGTSWDSMGLQSIVYFPNVQ